MLITRFVVGMLSMGLMFLGAGVACGQTTSTGSGQVYPNKPIRVVVGEPGGNTDFTARIITQGISGPLGQPVIVDNRPSSTIADTVARATADGYTLLLTGNITWLTPLIQKTAYDPVKAFAPITLATRVPAILVVHPSVPANSVKELIAYAKARPGVLNYNAGGIGSSAHLAGELFKSLAAVNIVAVPYKGTGPGLNALLANEVQLTIINAPSVTPHIKSGKLRALAVASAQPSALFPELPTVAATVPGYESVTLFGILAPAGTSPTTIIRLNRETARLLNTPETKEKFFSSGAEVVGSSPEQFAATIKSEMGRMGKVIKEAGIRAE